MSLFTPSRAVAAVAVALSLIPLSACSSSSNDAGSSKDVKIGYSGPFSRALQAVADNNQAALKIAVAELNKKGGADGRNYKLIVKDDALSPEKAVTQARQFLTQDKINLMIGPAVNTPFLAAEPVYAQAKMPQFLVGTAATGIDPEKYPNAWRGFFSGDVEAKLIISRLHDVHKVTKIAILAENTGSGLPGIDSLKKAIKATDGVELVTTEVFPAATADLGGYIAKIKKSGAQGIAMWSVGGPNTANVAKALDAAKLYLPVVGDIGAVFSTTTALAGDSLSRVTMEGAAYKSELYDKGGDAPAKAVALRDAVKKSLGVATLGDSFHLASMYYNIMYVIDAALEDSKGDSSPKALTKALISKPVTTPLGDVYTFSASNHNGISADNLSFASITPDSFKDGFWRRAPDAPR